MILPLLLLGAFPVVLGAQSSGKHAPTIDELLSLKSAGAPQIAPDAGAVAYLVTETDWKQDAFVSQLWLVKSGPGGDPRQLTRGETSVSQPRWSPDGTWIAFTSSRVDKKSQIFGIRPDGGEAVQLTNSETGVNGYAWSRDGKTIAFTAAQKSPSDERKKNLADYEVVRRDYAYVHLFTIGVAAAMTQPQAGKQRTRGADYSVGAFAWSPDGARIAFSATKNPDLVQGGTSDVYVLKLADDGVKKIVALKGPDGSPVWSPDGTQIAFSSSMERTPFFATNSRIAVVPADGGTPRSITDSFDEDVGPAAWTRDGIWFSALDRTRSALMRINPDGSGLIRINGRDPAIVMGASLTPDGSQAAITLASPTSMAEVAISPTAKWAPKVLTNMTSQADTLVTAVKSVISWKSRDGAEIEGVLSRPANFDSTRKYPLLVKIHGGPTGVDRPILLAATRYYPIDAWVARGTLALEVNYRGSAGYGEKFRTLNVRNLGVGDAWDVVSGVDFLIRKGWVDSTKVASMGWSQGGYISAFLTASSDRFAAISVGAGISDWATYYYNTDITPFTIHYLGADPVSDPEIYRKTSPISYIKNAKTPTLIQHGDGDRRVPIANGYELRQALEDRGVPVEMVVYKGFGHGITKPKSQRAVMTHNLVWFNHYIFGDPMVDLRDPIPAKAMQAGQPSKP